MKKNEPVAGFTFLLLNKTTGAPVTSGVVTGYVTLDNGSQNALSGAITHKGNGEWSVDLITAAETNGEIIGLLFAHADAVSVHFTIPTLEPAAGAGAIPWPYTLTDADTGVPIDGAEVWVTTDSLGANVIASGVTDDYGVVNFMLDAGTVYVWRKKAGWNFVNPDTEVVSV